MLQRRPGHQINCSVWPVSERLASRLSNCYSLLCKKDGNETGRLNGRNKLHSLQEITLLHKTRALFLEVV